MITSRSRSFLAAAIVGTLTLAACGGSDESSSDGDVCTELERVAEISEVGSAATTDAEIAAALRDIAAALTDVAAVAPDEIKAEAEKFAEASAVLAGIEEGQDELTDEQQAVVDDVEANAAAEAVREYAIEECGIDI